MCAADRLRLHYSPDDVARYGERHVLQKAIASVNALNDYFSAIAKKLESIPSNVRSDK